MADAVQPDSKAVQQLLQRSRSLWSSYAAATTNLRFPVECIQLRNILSRAPAFPTSSLQANKKLSTLRYHDSRLGLRISGISTWHTSLGECNLPPKIVCHELLCGVNNSVACVFAEHSRFSDWPGVQEGDGQATEGNHLAILLLVWAYILSARWVELQSSYGLGGSRMQYSDLRAAWLNNDEDIPAGAIKVDIGETCDRAARWWVAILAPGEGWRATLELGDKLYRSPWSAHIASTQNLKLQKTPTHDTMDIGPSVADKQSHIALSSDEALDCLWEYCENHGISSQCIPALAASLFLPWKNSDEDASVVLPLPKPSRAPTSEPQQKPVPSSLPFQRTLQDESRLLPYYMTLSCNIWGMRALLCGSFFDPAVSCNLVSPWMQPVFEIIDPIIAREEFTSFAIIMSRRQPSLAALWLGAIILGMEKTILQSVRIGLLAVELHAAAWTGTSHSFISLRPHASCATPNNEISRSDECRLLYLTGSESHRRAPVCPWQPFGTTPLGLADIEVQQHATCKGHCLEYVGWRWDTDDGLSSEDRGFEENTVVDRWDATATEIDASSVTAQAKGFLKSELLSEVSTRSIFGWLRVDGYPPIEKDIFAHDWFDVGSSSEESAVSDNNSPSKELSSVNAWLYTK